MPMAESRCRVYNSEKKQDRPRELTACNARSQFEGETESKWGQNGRNEGIGFNWGKETFRKEAIETVGFARGKLQPESKKSDKTRKKDMAQ